MKTYKPIQSADAPRRPVFTPVHARALRLPNRRVTLLIDEEGNIKIHTKRLIGREVYVHEVTFTREAIEPTALEILMMLKSLDRGEYEVPEATHILEGA